MSKIYPIGSEPKPKPKSRVRDTFNDKVDPRQEKAGREALNKLVKAKLLKDFEQGNVVKTKKITCRILPNRGHEVLMFKYAEMLRLKG